jgi:hypothetical protein
LHRENPVPDGFASNGYGDLSPGKYNLISCFFAETIATFFFLYVIIGTTSKGAAVGFAGIPIGLCLTLIHLFLIPITNASVNPARSTGPALFAGSAYIGQLWLFWVAGRPWREWSRVGSMMIFRRVTFERGSFDGYRGRMAATHARTSRYVTKVSKLNRSSALKRPKRRMGKIVPEPHSCTATQISKLSTIASAGRSRRSPESGSIRLVMTAPPIIDGGWFQALAIINWVCKSSIRKRITGYSVERLVFEREAAAEYDLAFAHVTRYFMPFVLRTASHCTGYAHP